MIADKQIVGEQYWAWAERHTRKRIRVKSLSNGSPIVSYGLWEAFPTPQDKGNSPASDSPDRGG